MESSQGIRYLALLKPGDMRLVELLPGEINDPVQIQIRTHNLHSYPKYEALSYTWGDPSDMRSILCEGTSHRVTSNLFKCLLHLRRKESRPYLWIDAISINQDDISEKNIAVQMMPAYYAQSMRTICWVPSPLSRAAIQLVEDLHHFQGVMIPGSCCITTSDIYHSDCKVTEDVLEKFNSEQFVGNSGAWQSLHHFLSEAYFSRVWIMQDLICSKSLIVQSGHDEISWTTLCSAIKVGLLFAYGQYVAPGAATIMVADYFRTRADESSSPYDFEDYLIGKQSTLTLRAADPRDHIYAALSFLRVSDWHDAIVVDYSSPVQMVYQQASQMIPSLSLSLAGGNVRVQEDNRVQSWVPDWEHSKVRFLLNHPSSRFGSSKMTQRTDMKASPEGVLSSGLQVDAIAELSEYLPPRRHCDHYNVHGANILVFDEWFEFVDDALQSSKWKGVTETEGLLRFTDTIHARGCNSIWEPRVPLDSRVVVERTKRFRNFLEDENAEVTAEIRLFHAACFPSHDRRLGITRRGYLCLVPEDSVEGDIVCILDGHKVPMILRKVHNGFRNIGESYVNGLMNGEADTLAGCEKTVFTII